MPGTKNKQNVPGRFARYNEFSEEIHYPAFLQRVAFSNFILHNF